MEPPGGAHPETRTPLRGDPHSGALMTDVRSGAGDGAARVSVSDGVDGDDLALEGEDVLLDHEIGAA
jgi:hypothetical protein